MGKTNNSGKTCNKKKDLQFEMSSSSSSVSEGSSVDSLDEVVVEEIIYPGKIMSEDYILLIKIGYGNNASVWMSYQISKDRYVALKIQDYQCYDDGRREVSIIKKINDLGKTNTTRCITMLDSFILKESTSRDGDRNNKDDDMKFVCSVYELYAGSLYLLIHDGKYKYGLPIPIVKKITKQLLEALNFIHTKAEVLHTDIKPENILFKGVPASHSKVIEIFENSGFKKKYDKLKKEYESGNDLRSVSETDSEIESGAESVNEDEKNVDVELRRKQLFNTKTNALAKECVIEIQEIDDVFENHTNSDDDNSDSDGSIIEGEDDFSDSDGDGDNESDSDGDNESGSLDEIPDGSDESNESNESEEEPCLNTRRQSVSDTASFIRYKEKISIEEHYDFVKVLNNREKSEDKEEVIDDKYVNACQIAITDFGNSYFYKKRTENEIQDRIYRSPEVIMDFKYGYPSDIWSLGCVIYELLTGFPLFNPEEKPLTKDIHHLFLMEKMLGPIPVNMKKKSKRSKFLFDEKRHFHIKNLEPIKPFSLEDVLIKQCLFTKREAREISDFLRKTLEYIPSKRATAEELLNHPWVK